MYKYLLILCLAINVSYASAVKLVDYMVSSSGIETILGKYGIKGADAKQVQSYTQSSLAALSSKSAKLDQKELLNALVMLKVSGEDATIRKSLQVLLDTPEDKLTKKAVVDAINNLIYLANRHGKSAIITCSQCVNDNLARDGFKFTVGAVKDSSTVKVLNNFMIADDRGRHDFIAQRMRRLGMGDYSKVTPKEVSKEDEKLLAIYLGLAESGTAEQKALISSIKKLSTRNGKTNIIDPQNSHKFWRVLSDDMSKEDMAGWTRTLDEVAQRAQADKVTAEEAFYRTLKDKAAGNEYLTKQYETLKAKGCFFK